MSAPIEDMVAAAAGLADGAAAARWRGSDPYDGLWWNWPGVLTAGKRRRQALVQLHARAPVDVRRLYPGARPPIPKALGAFGAVAARLYRLTGDERHRQDAHHALALLDGIRDAGHRAWGYQWDVQTRWSFYPAGTPNVVVTAFAAAGLDEGGRLIGEDRFRTRARESARWALDEMFVEPEGLFAYHADSTTPVHNASLLGARLVHSLLDEAEARTAAARAVERALATQRPDGSWAYGEGLGLGFVDSFHTGYVLRCLLDLRDLVPGAERAVAAGARFYAERFFDDRGRAMLWPGRDYPEDGHSAGTALTTLAALNRAGFGYEELLDRVVRRVLAAMLRDGRVVHRRYRLGRTTVRYVRWCDAHVALGLTDAALALSPASAEATSITIA